MATIATLSAKEIKDSRGNPTIEVTCTLAHGASGTASVPSGASTGVHEAVELRDHDMEHDNGLGVQKAIAHVTNEILTHVQNKEFSQSTLDHALIELDGTKNKSRLGANAILGVSLSFARACAEEAHVPLYTYIGTIAGTTSFVLPQPFFNVINGGKHADSGLDIQEFMLVPTGFPTFRAKVQAGTKIIATLKEQLESKGYETTLGDEGGFAPKLPKNEDGLSALLKAIEGAGFTTSEVQLGIDVAASSFYTSGEYVLKHMLGEKKTTSDMVKWYESLVQQFPIISI